MSRCKSPFVPITAAFVPALVFAVGLTSSAFGQVSPGVPANFGVEGDLQADTTQFGGFGVGLTTDDWFDAKPGPGFEGIGVIDTTGGAAFRALILPGGAAANRTFVRHMAFPFGEIVNGYLLHDAVYARDNHSAGGEVDSTVFVIGHKNIDNPRMWSMVAGSTPVNDDIVDVYAHIRRDGDEPTDSLWLLTAMSTMASNGDAHIDFELFWTVDTSLSGSNMFDGPDSGRIAWSVDGTGDLLAGDVIFSIDFQAGGSYPIPGIRIWIRDGDQAAIEAASDIVFSGIFYDGGEAAGPFGYADVVVPVGASFARVNGLAGDPQPWATLAAPWGSLEGPQATFHDSMLALQFAEAGVNVTALGLDPSATGDPSAELSRYIFFKTRSSQSFTAGLKDFVGPHPFGQVTVPYGDANGDGIVNVADVVYLVNYLYRGGDPPISLEAGDANCDDIVNVADIVYLVNYLYRGGDPPGCP